MGGNSKFGIPNQGRGATIGEELYDMDEDPREVQNLADRPEYKELLLGYRRELEDWQRLTQDAWLVRDGVSLSEMQGHIDAGLQIPDRFDFDLAAPGNKTL
jgi:N-sulfoglucosamine sulfohydrolase